MQVVRLVYATDVRTHARVRVGVKRDVGALRVNITHGRRKIVEETNVARPVVVMLTDYDGRVHLAALAMIRRTMH